MIQERLAELINVKPQHLSDIERGKKGTSVASVRRICTELHITSDYILFGRTEDDHPLLVERVKTFNKSEESLSQRAINFAFETYHLGATGVKRDIPDWTDTSDSSPE